MPLQRKTARFGEKNGSAFVRGAAVLSAAVLAVKAIGAVYRIPLTRTIGAGEMGIYAAVFSVYMLIGTLAGAGIPNVAAQLCAARLRSGDEAGALSVFAVSKRLLLVFGAAGAMSTALFARPIAACLGMPQAAPAIRAMSPGILADAWIAAYRARLQGMQRMGGVAVSQIVQQIVRAASGLLFAHLFLSYGEGMGAAGAMLGMTVSEFAAIASLHASAGRTKGAYESQTAQSLLRLSLPLMLGGCIAPLCSMAESMMLVPRMAAFGVSAQQALADYGVLTAMTGTIVALPLMLTGALGMSLMPDIAAAKNRMQRCRRVRQGMAAALVLAVGAGVCLALFSDDLIGLLYHTAPLSQRILAGRLLRLQAASIVPHCVSIVAAASLQGFGKTKESAICQGLCAALKTGAAWLLLARQGIEGVCIASIFSAAVGCTAALGFLRRACGERVLKFSMLGYPLFGAALFCAAAASLQRMFGYGTLSLAGAFTLGAAVYLVACAPLLMQKEAGEWERSPSSGSGTTRAR